MPKNNIAKIRKERGWTQQHLADLLGYNAVQTVGRIENGISGLSDKKASELAKVLGVSLIDLYDDSDDKAGRIAISVRGYVEAGVWREAVEWPEDQQYEVVVQKDFYADMSAVAAVEVRGNSMNMRYPEGTVLLFTDQVKTREKPIVGKRYIVERSRIDGQFESTVKRLDQTEDGQWWLMAESDDPRFMAPIPIVGREGDNIRLIGRVRGSIILEN